jgi:hexosaminidase
LRHNDDGVDRATVWADGGSDAYVGLQQSVAAALASAAACLDATTVVGAMRGLETLQQRPHPTQRVILFPQWRVLMIDRGRHLIIVVSTAAFDGGAPVRLNVFHCHLSDDQGFLIEIPTFSKHAGLGIGWTLLYAGAGLRSRHLCARPRWQKQTT